jgi:hypothetical protein
MMTNGTIGSGSGSHSANAYPHGSCSSWNNCCLPHLTALASTLLQMELLLDCPVLDLYALAKVVQRDTGLATQLLQLANADRHPEDHMLSIEDCLLDLGIRWLLAIVRELPLSTQEDY